MEINSPTEQSNSQVTEGLNVPKQPSKFPILAIVVGSLIILAIISSIILFATGNILKPNQQPLTSTTKLSGYSYPVIDQADQIVLPISTDEPFVNNFNVIYSFVANIKEIKETPNGLELITDLQLKNLPPFIATPESIIYEQFSALEFKRVDISKLQPNQKIRVLMFYAFKRNAWNTHIINIDLTNNLYNNSTIDYIK